MYRCDVFGTGKGREREGNIWWIGVQVRCLPYFSGGKGDSAQLIETSYVISPYLPNVFFYPMLIVGVGLSNIGT